MKDIASDLGVSLMTVSKALRNHSDISEDTRNRVQKRAREVGYRPNWIARSLVTRRTYMVGLVIPDLMHSFFAEVDQFLISPFGPLLRYRPGLNRSCHFGVLLQTRQSGDIAWNAWAVSLGLAALGSSALNAEGASRRSSRTFWIAKWAAVGVANALDIQSSRGRGELNPLYRQSSGRFAPRKAALLKAGIHGGFFGVQVASSARVRRRTSIAPLQSPTWLPPARPVR